MLFQWIIAFKDLWELAPWSNRQAVATCTKVCLANAERNEAVAFCCSASVCFQYRDERRLRSSTCIVPVCCQVWRFWKINCSCLTLSHWWWSVANMCECALVWEMCVCSFLCILYVCVQKHILYLLMCVTANRCELPLTHKNLMKHDELRVVSFGLLNWQSKRQSSSSKSPVSIHFPSGWFVCSK